MRFWQLSGTHIVAGPFVNQQRHMPVSETSKSSNFSCIPDLNNAEYIIGHFQYAS